MDRHDLHVSFREGPVGIFVFVDATIVQETQKTIEQMETQVLAIPMRNDRVVVITLEGVQELRKDCKVARRILLFHSGRKRRQGKQLIKIVCRTQVKRL